MQTDAKLELLGIQIKVKNHYAKQMVEQSYRKSRFQSYHCKSLKLSVDLLKCNIVRAKCPLLSFGYCYFECQLINEDSLDDWNGGEKTKGVPERCQGYYFTSKVLWNRLRNDQGLSNQGVFRKV